VAATRGKLQQVIHLGGLSVKELVQRVCAEVQADNCLGQAAQLAYYAIFALFPFMLFLITLVGYLPVPNLTKEIMNLLGKALPTDALSLVQNNVEAIVSDQRSGLLSFGIVLAIWSASSAVTAIIDTLNQAYGVREGRPFWKVRGLAVLLTIGLAVFIILTMLLLVFGPQIGPWIAKQVNLGSVFEFTWNIFRWPVIAVLMMVATAILYYFAPDVEQDWK
jgi:membrane protein